MSRIWLLLLSGVGSVTTSTSQGMSTSRKPYPPFQKLHNKIPGSTFSLPRCYVQQFLPLKVRLASSVCTMPRTRCTAVLIACMRSGRVYAHSVVGTIAAMMLMHPMKMRQARNIAQDGVFCQQGNAL